jgi:L-ribulokinase
LCGWRGVRVAHYPSGKQGVLLNSADHNLARQHPGDYLFGLKKSVRAALAAAEKKNGFSADKVVGIGIDATTSSPLPVDARNHPLALQTKWRRNLNAQCWLWLERPHEPEGSRSHHGTGGQTSPTFPREVRQYLFRGMVLGEDLTLPERRT